MNQVLLGFRTELDGLRQSIDLVDSLAELRAQPAAASLSRTRVGRSAQRTHTTLRQAGRWEIIVLDGGVLYVSALFESTIRELVRLLVDNVAIHAGTYHQVSETVQKSNLRGVAEFLRRADEPRFSHLLASTIVEDLAVALNAGTPLRLFADGFAITDRNMRHGEVADLFRRAGLQELWPKLGREAQLQQHFGLSQEDTTTKAAQGKLDAFMETRNAIAHRSPAYQSTGPGVLRDHIDFFEALVASLVAVVTTWVASI